MTENTVQFLPFHAINEFMRPDFRLKIVRQTLLNLNQLPDKLQGPINTFVRKSVKVPGFRNSLKAPTSVKIVPTANAFEKSPDLVAAIISAWTYLNTDLKIQVYEVLKNRNWYLLPGEIQSPGDLPEIKSESEWGVLPLDADRTMLPGFLIYWPKDQHFEAIYDSYTGLYPDGDASLDEVSLMAVWLSNRLPYHIVGEDENEANSPDENGDFHGDPE